MHRPLVPVFHLRHWLGSHMSNIDLLLLGIIFHFEPFSLGNICGIFITLFSHSFWGHFCENSPHGHSGWGENSPLPVLACQPSLSIRNSKRTTIQAGQANTWWLYAGLYCASRRQICPWDTIKHEELQCLQWLFHPRRVFKTCALILILAPFRGLTVEQIACIWFVCSQHICEQPKCTWHGGWCRQIVTPPWK